MPVSERARWAMNPARSTLARALLSKTENRQMPTKPIAIENSAGKACGNSTEPSGLPSVASFTEGEKTVSATDAISPKKPPITAHLVVQSFHETLMNSTGKLAKAAMANASDILTDQVILHGASIWVVPKNRGTQRAGRRSDQARTEGLGQVYRTCLRAGAMCC